MTARERAFLWVGAVVVALAVAVSIFSWGQSGCGVSGCAPLTVGGATNSIQYNAGGTLGGLSLGTSTTVLHGNASGTPSYGSVNIATEVTGFPTCGDSAGQHLNVTAGALSCGSSTPTLSGTSVSLGGGLLAIGGCTSGTVPITGAVVGMVAYATPTTYPGDGSFWSASVTSTNTVTVKICAVIALTPTATTYNVRVLP